MLRGATLVCTCLTILSLPFGGNFQKMENLENLGNLENLARARARTDETQMNTIEKFSHIYIRHATSKV